MEKQKEKKDNRRDVLKYVLGNADFIGKHNTNKTDYVLYAVIAEPKNMEIGRYTLVSAYSGKNYKMRVSKTITNDDGEKEYLPNFKDVSNEDAKPYLEKAHKSFLAKVKIS